MADLIVATVIDGFVLPHGAGACGRERGVVGGGGRGADGQQHEALAVAAILQNLQCGGLVLGPADDRLPALELDARVGFPGGRVDDLLGTDQPQVLPDGIVVIGRGLQPRHKTGQARDDAGGDGGRFGLGQDQGQRPVAGAVAAVPQQVFVGRPMLGISLRIVRAMQRIAEGGCIVPPGGEDIRHQPEPLGVFGQRVGEVVEQVGPAAVIRGQIISGHHRMSSPVYGSSVISRMV